MVTREYRIAYAAFAPSPRVRSLWLGPHLARFEQDGPLAGRRIEREDVVGLNPDAVRVRRPVRAAVDDEPLVQRVIHDRVVQAGRGAGPEVLAMSGIEAFLQDLPAVRGGVVRDHPAVAGHPRSRALGRFAQGRRPRDAPTESDAAGGSRVQCRPEDQGHPPRVPSRLIGPHHVAGPAPQAGLARWRPYATP